MGASAFPLILVLIPGIGTRVGGASRWFRLGGISFQPAEFSKLVLVIFLAYSMTKQRDVMKTFFKGFVFHLGVVRILCGLGSAEPDLGMAISLLLVTGMLLFVGGVRLRHLFLSLLPVVPLAYLLVWQVPYRRARVLSYLDPWRDPLGSGFHLIHSFSAFGSGGLTGQGLGKAIRSSFTSPNPIRTLFFPSLPRSWVLSGSWPWPSCFCFLMARSLGPP